MYEVDFSGRLTHPDGIELDIYCHQVWKVALDCTRSNKIRHRDSLPQTIDKHSTSYFNFRFKQYPSCIIYVGPLEALLPLSQTINKTRKNTIRIILSDTYNCT